MTGEQLAFDLAKFLKELQTISDIESPESGCIIGGEAAFKIDWFYFALIIKSPWKPKVF